MRTTLVAAVLLVLAGCGGKEDGKSGPAAASFTLDAPASPVEVLNGGPAVKTPIEVRFKSGAREEVTFSSTVEPAGAGVSATVEPAVLPDGEGTVQAVVRASETARPGDYKVTVTAKAARAGTATKEIAVKVPPID
jgi:hypothetical protein